MSCSHSRKFLPASILRYSGASVALENVCGAARGLFVSTPFELLPSLSVAEFSAASLSIAFQLLSS